MKSKFIIVAVLLAGCNSPYQLTESEQSTAELGARDFAERADVEFLSCSGQDSDGDNYVTCSTKGGELLCSYLENSRGCKAK